MPLRPREVFKILFGRLYPQNLLLATRIAKITGFWQRGKIQKSRALDARKHIITPFFE